MRRAGSHASFIVHGHFARRRRGRRPERSRMMRGSRRFLLFAVLAGLLVRPADLPAKGPPPGAGPPPGKGPSSKVRGKYVLRIAGYYTGSGELHATGAGVRISAAVRDPAGTLHQLATDPLDVVNDRFRGSGTLAGGTVEVDGRLDPKDGQRGQVLKSGRVTFTFRSSSGHFARGAGDQREPE